MGRKYKMYKQRTLKFECSDEPDEIAVSAERGKTCMRALMLLLLSIRYDMPHLGGACCLKNFNWHHAKRKSCLKMSSFGDHTCSPGKHLLGVPPRCTPKLVLPSSTATSTSAAAGAMTTFRCWLGISTHDRSCWPPLLNNRHIFW